MDRVRNERVLSRDTTLVVFDLDGTLVDSRRDLAESVNAMLAEYGHLSLSEEEVGEMVGDGARVLVQRALAARGADVDPQEALRRFLAIYDAHLLDHTRPYDGIPEVVEKAASLAALAVLTNKPLAASRRILDALGLSRYFAAVIGGDGPLPRKPDPTPLFELMQSHGAQPDQTLLVGDSRVDLETARRAAVRICLAAYGFGFRFEPGDLQGVRVARKPSEILDCLAA